MATRKIYDAAAHAAELVQLPQFSGSDDFIPNIHWTSSTECDILCTNNSSAEELEIAHCIFVGRVSYDKPYLQPHGNFNTTYKNLEKSARGAKLQFTLERPADSILGPLYDRSYINSETMEGLVAGGELQQHFLSRDNKRTMCFNHPLWERKDAENSTPTRNAITTAYTVNDWSAPYWTKLKVDHQIRPLVIYNTENKIITDISQIALWLPGAVVEVVASHKHFLIERPNQPPSDTYVAIIESISILRNAPKIIRSPVKYSPVKPKHIPVTPSRLRIAAADPERLAAIPQPIFVPSTGSPGSAPSASTSGSASLGAAITFKSTEEGKGGVPAGVDANQVEVEKRVEGSVAGTKRAREEEDEHIEGRKDKGKQKQVEEEVEEEGEEEEEEEEGEEESVVAKKARLA